MATALLPAVPAGGLTWALKPCMSDAKCTCLLAVAGCVADGGGAFLWPGASPHVGHVIYGAIGRPA